MELSGGSSQGKWEMNHTRRHREVVEVGDAPLAILERLQQSLSSHARIVWICNDRHARCDINDPGKIHLT